MSTPTRHANSHQLLVYQTHVIIECTSHASSSAKSAATFKTAFALSRGIPRIGGCHESISITFPPIRVIRGPKSMLLPHYRYPAADDI
jgi:hypothetical protein